MTAKNTSKNIWSFITKRDLTGQITTKHPTKPKRYITKRRTVVSNNHGSKVVPFTIFTLRFEDFCKNYVQYSKMRKPFIYGQKRGFNLQMSNKTVYKVEPNLYGHRVYDGSESNTLKHIENTKFLRHGRTG